MPIAELSKLVCKISPKLFVDRLFTSSVDESIVQVFVAEFDTIVSFGAALMFGWPRRAIGGSYL